MIEAASAQLRDLVDELSLVTRIERGRYSPALTEADSLDLAREACAVLIERVAVSGEGAAVQVDPEATSRASGLKASASTRIAWPVCKTSSGRNAIETRVAV